MGCRPWASLFAYAFARSDIGERKARTLTPSLRTRGMAVVQACLSMDLGVRSQGSPVEVNGVAVLNCCTSRLCELNAQIVESGGYGKETQVISASPRTPRAGVRRCGQDLCQLFVAAGHQTDGDAHVATPTGQDVEWRSGRDAHSLAGQPDDGS